MTHHTAALCTFISFCWKSWSKHQVRHITSLPHTRRHKEGLPPRLNRASWRFTMWLEQDFKSSIWGWGLPGPISRPHTAFTVRTIKCKHFIVLSKRGFSTWSDPSALLVSCSQCVCGLLWDTCTLVYIVEYYRFYICWVTIKYLPPIFCASSTTLISITILFT